MSKKNTCDCGSLKDVRAKRCILCCTAPKSTKNCSKCGVNFPIDNFPFKMCQGVQRHRSDCDKCRALYTKMFKQANPEKSKEASKKYAIENPHQVRKWAFRSRWRKMGFNPDDVQQMLKDNNQGCEICGSLNKLVVDHDHSLNKLRGVLCSECNFGIGKFKDNPDYLKKAINYLDNFHKT